MSKIIIVGAVSSASLNTSTEGAYAATATGRRKSEGGK